MEFFSFKMRLFFGKGRGGAGCKTLSKVDLTGLLAVTTIGDHFLSSCPALQTVHGKDKCSNVVRSRVGHRGKR